MTAPTDTASLDLAEQAVNRFDNASIAYSKAPAYELDEARDEYCVARTALLAALRSETARGDGLATDRDNWRQAANHWMDRAQTFEREGGEILTETKALRDLLLGMSGLITLITGRDDMPDEMRAAILTNHRYLDTLKFLHMPAPDFYMRERTP